MMKSESILPASVHRKWHRSALSVVLGFAALMPLTDAPLHAQSYGADPAAELRDAVRRLADDPQNSFALLEAGNAALEMNDADAAAGFFLRAQAVDPMNAQVKLGLAKARLRQEDPVSAIALFDQAASLGLYDRSYLADKALAYDLVGALDKAQQTYDEARRTNGSPMLTLRYAISLDLSGKRSEASQLLTPLLKANDPGAWRAHAFLLAAHGDMKQARSVANSFLGPQKAGQLDYYLSNMSELSVAQQMAAIHFGHFPRGGFGKDTPAIASLQSRLGVGTQGSAKSEKGKARPPSFIDFRGRKQKSVSYTPPKTANQVLAAAPKPVPAPKIAEPKSKPSEALAAAGRNAAPDPKRQPQSAAAVKTPSKVQPSKAEAPPVKVAVANDASRPNAPAPTAEQRPVMPQPALVEPQAEPSLANQAQPQPNSQPAPQPAAVASEPAVKPVTPLLTDMPDLRSTAPAPAPATAEKRDLSALLSDIAIPDDERKQDIVPVTADMVEFAANPSRNWVQLATGGDIAALRFDYRKFVRQNEALFEGHEGWTSPWKNGLNRLVVGPFESLADARDWEKQYREAGGDGFVWQSDNGMVVEALPAR